MAAELNARTITVNGWPIALRQGTAGQVDVVLLHGIPGSGHSWDPVLARLPDTIRPFVPDLLGFGASGRPTRLEDLHAAGQARRLEAALEACGAVRPVLVGHDFGGPAALHMIMRAAHKYAGLILAATNTFGDTPIPFPLSMVTVPVVQRLAARVLFSRPALAGMCRLGARKGRVDMRAALGDARQTAAIRTIFAASLTQLATLYEPIARALPRLSLPTLVLWGDHDPFFPVSHGERLAGAIPNASLTVLDGCGHFLPEEEPATVARLIAAFALAQAPATSARTPTLAEE